jgi:H+/Cl- antiporter ClcA
MREELELKTVVVWVVVLAVVITAAGIGLVYLGFVAQALPSGFGVLSNVDPTLRMVVLIAILAAIAVGAWLALLKVKAADR